MPAHMRVLAKPTKGTATRARRAKKRASDRTLAVNAAKVRERDGDRCRVCGSAQGLQVHHIRYRSRGGNHATHNLVLVCGSCHDAIHSHTLVLSGDPDDMGGLAVVRATRARPVSVSTEFL